MHSSRPFLALGLLAGATALSLPAAAPRPPDAETATSRFQFTLIPKAFTKNPTLEMTINTQLTDYGRSLPEVSREHPAYYIAHDGGYRQMGEVVGGEHPPPPVDLQRRLIAALAERGYLPATDKSPPDLILFFNWGSHNAMDSEQAAMFPELAARQNLERAMLVGGSGYRRREGDRIEFGSSLFDFSPKSDYLHYQTVNDLYYAIVSAYDFTALAHKERKLAWRTTMTVNATGVSMTETLPVLLTSASYYFGRDTAEPVAILRALRRGTVHLGPLRIIERVPDPEPAPKK